MFLVTGVVFLAIRLLNLPLNRIIEARYCKQYYLRHDPSVIDPNGEVPEKLCKISPVQEKLVWLESALFVALTACDIVAAIPLGSISDRLGRKPIICSNVVASIAVFTWLLVVGKTDGIPVEAMLLAPFATLLGGSDCVFQSVILAYLSDFAKDTQTRIKYFAYMSSMSYVFSLLGPVIASVTMSVNVWLPFYLGLGLLGCALPLTAILSSPPKAHYNNETPAIDSNGDLTEAAPLIQEANEEGAPEAKPPSGPNIVWRVLPEMKETLQFILGKRNLQQILIVVLLLGLAKSSMEILVVYLSKRYDRTFAEVGYLLSIKAAVNIVLLTVIIPLLLKLWLKKFPGLQITADFFGAQGSLILSCIGTFYLGLAGRLWMAITALVIYGLGTATSVFILSLVKSPVISTGDDNAAGRDLSIVVMVQTIGTLIGTPVFAALWVKGLNAGGTLLGLPYFAASAFNLGILVIVLNLHQRWRKNLEQGLAIQVV